MANGEILICDKKIDSCFSDIGHYCINTYLCIQEVHRKCQQRAINIRQGFVTLRKQKPS